MIMKHVVILRGKETSADVSDLKGDLVKTGEIIFTIKPLDAEPVVKIDGKTVNYTYYVVETAASGFTTETLNPEYQMNGENVEYANAETGDTVVIINKETEEPVLC